MQKDAAAPRGETDEELAQTRRKRQGLLALFAALLVFVVCGGFFLQRNWVSSDSVDLNPLLNQALRQFPNGNFPVDFSGTRDIPGGPGLIGWLDGFPQPERILSLTTPFIAAYTVEGGGDWDLSRNPQGQITARAPLPDFRGIKLEAKDIVLKTSVALSDEDRLLAQQILAEQANSLLREEENGRRTERLAEIRAKLRAFMVELLEKHHQPIPEKFDVRFSEESSDNEQGPDDAP